MSDTFQLSEKNAERAKHFFNVYELEKALIDDGTTIILSDTIQKVCRFCKKSHPEVSFKKDAHVIPKFFGNISLLSSFECDTCNVLFSKYEDSFANYLGVRRTIFSYISQRRVPKFKNEKTDLVIAKENDTLFTKISGNLGDEIVIDDENKVMTINTVRKSYIPMYIPKVLFKIGFCMIEESDLSDYELLRLFLQSDELNEKFEGNHLLKVFTYTFSGIPLYRPKALLYNKKLFSSEVLAPQKVLVVHFSNFVCQVCLPYSEKDKHLIDQKSNFYIYPLMMDEGYLNTSTDCDEEFLDFSNTTKRINETQRITLSFEQRIKDVQK